MEQAYRPRDDAELWARAEAMQWLTIMEWPEEVIASIMRDGNPCIETLRRMVYRVGPDAALQVIIQFTFDGELPNGNQSHGL